MPSNKGKIAFFDRQSTIYEHMVSRKKSQIGSEFVKFPHCAKARFCMTLKIFRENNFTEEQFGKPVIFMEIFL